VQLPHPHPSHVCSLLTDDVALIVACSIVASTITLQRPPMRRTIAATSCSASKPTSQSHLKEWEAASTPDHCSGRFIGSHAVTIQSGYDDIQERATSSPAYSERLDPEPRKPITSGTAFSWRSAAGCTSDIDETGVACILRCGSLELYLLTFAYAKAFLHLGDI